MTGITDVEDPDVPTGACIECGHINQRNWVMCDKCGAHLPWAPAKIRRNINNLSAEELGALCAASPDPARNKASSMKYVPFSCVSCGGGYS